MAAGKRRGSLSLQPSSMDDPSATYEEKPSPDASSAGFCPGSPRNSVFSWFLLLVTHQVRQTLTYSSENGLLHGQSEAGGCSLTPVGPGVRHEPGLLATQS